MDFKTITDATTKVLITYLTYQAVRTIAEQLSEMDPKQSVWFRRFSGQTAIQDGEEYLQRLFAENPAMAFRVMEVRAHIAETIADRLPELTKTGMRQANQQQQTQFMERAMQLQSPESREERPEIE